MYSVNFDDITKYISQNVDKCNIFTEGVIKTFMLLGWKIIVSYDEYGLCKVNLKKGKYLHIIKIERM